MVGGEASGRYNKDGLGAGWERKRERRCSADGGRDLNVCSTIGVL